MSYDKLGYHWNLFHLISTVTSEGANNVRRHGAVIAHDLGSPHPQPTMVSSI